MSDILSPGSGAVTQGFARLDRIVMRWVKVFLRISNRADFDALRAHPQVEFSFIGPGMRIPHADLIILPGSKRSEERRVGKECRSRWSPYH